MRRTFLGVWAIVLLVPGAATAQENEDDALAELRKEIAGREREPAETVFRNIQLLKSVPAANLLAIMDIGYNQSLGVDCAHCHNPENWASEEKPQKQIARDMSAMVREINERHLRSIPGLESETPLVNCTTYHRWQKKPALNMESPGSS